MINSISASMAGFLELNLLLCVSCSLAEGAKPGDGWSGIWLHLQAFAMMKQKLDVCFVLVSGY